jgi:ectoine hydroxylase-related dioxygenase (phytanoyl-CoA dioxygenase family)
MLNRTILAIATEQVGRNAALSSFQAILKPRGGKPLDLHVDELIAPAPYSVHTGSINVTIPLTDYTIEAGPTSYVPGSHKFMRAPVGKEGWEQRVPVTARKGSLIIWPNMTWHGNYTGTAPGLRMALVLVFARPHMRTLEDYRDDVTEEMLRRNPPRFAKLMGRHISYGWKAEGPVLDGSETLIGATAYS